MGIMYWSSDVCSSVLMTLPLRAFIAGDAGIAPLFLFALMVVVGLVYGRVLLIFPAAAVDDPLGFSESFALTRGNSWRSEDRWVGNGCDRTGRYRCRRVHKKKT